MGREELTEDGAAPRRPAPQRPGGVTRYGDRFRPAATAPGLDLDRAGEDDRVDLGNDAPARTWPTWLTRGAAGLGVAATAAIAIAMGDREDSAPQAVESPPAQALQDKYPTRAPVRAAPPSMAALVSSRVEDGVWDHGRFTVDDQDQLFEITLTGVVIGAVDVDVVSGTSSTCAFLGGPPRFGSTYWC